MDDYGWFVTVLMYGGMLISLLVVRPISLIVRLVERFPKPTLNVAFVAGGAACLMYAVHHRQNAPLFTWIGFGMLFAALVMVFFVKKEPIRPSRCVPVADTRDNWFHD